MEQRTYTGWKAALAAIGITVAVFAALNLLFQDGDRGPKRPLPEVTTVRP